MYDNLQRNEVHNVKIMGYSMFAGGRAAHIKFGALSRDGRKNQTGSCPKVVCVRTQ